MPFIDVKVSVEMSRKQKDVVKQELGKAVTTFPGKSESWLMVNITDNCDLYFKGNKDGATAFVDLKLFGKVAAADCSKMTAEICRILSDQLSISPERVFTAYQGYENWGWNGNNL